jgi:hypothetical protein
VPRLGPACRVRLSTSRCAAPSAATSHAPAEAPPAPTDTEGRVSEPPITHRPLASVAPLTALPPRPPTSAPSSYPLAWGWGWPAPLETSRAPTTVVSTSGSLRHAGTRTRAALRGRPRRPRSPLRPTPNPPTLALALAPSPRPNPHPHPHPRGHTRRAARPRREERARAGPRAGSPRRQRAPWARRGEGGRHVPHVAEN